MAQKIFVYGSLRTGMYNYDKYLKRHIIQSELAYVKGQLYHLKGVQYPALLKGDNMIAGEIMEITNDTILHDLDVLEGWHGENNEENEYHKVLTDIYDDRGFVVDHLYVYFYNVKNDRYACLLDQKIADSDYVRYIYQNSQS